MASGDLPSGNPLDDISKGIGVVDDFMGLFRGKKTTTSNSNKKTLDTLTTETEEVSAEKAMALIQQMLGSTQGLAAIAQGEKSSGLYNSTVNQQLTNDLLARTAGEIAKLSSTKSTSQTGTIDESTTNTQKKKGALEWVICTELHKQGRLSDAHYKAGWPVFSRTPVAVKRGYYLWAIPAVLHLRKHPQSLVSRVLASVMTARAAQIAGEKSVYGWLTLKGLYAICWTLSRTVARKHIDYTVLYPTK